MKNEKNILIIVPVHQGEVIGPGLLLKIIAQTGLSKEEFYTPNANDSFIEKEFFFAEEYNFHKSIETFQGRPLMIH